MEFIMEMLKIVWPLLLTGVISLFIILRLKRKFKGRTSNNVTREEIVGAYFMPFGIIIGAIYSSFSSVPLSIGPSVGFLLGYVAYEVYSRKGEGAH